LEFFGIPWNYLELFLEFLENLHKIPLEFLELLWNSWNSNGITGIPLGLLHDEKFQLFPPRIEFYSPFCVQAKIIKLVGLKNGGRLSPINLVTFAGTQNGE
jgi:hypothetical protein